MFNVKSYDYKNKIKKNNVSFSSGLDSDIDDIISNALSNTYHSTPVERSKLTQVFDLLSIGQYASAGLVRGIIPGNDINPIEGVVGGVRSALPYLKNYEDGKHTYSDVVGDLGWNPTSTGGKIVKGGIGLVGDVFLDPLTYISGGSSLALKGSGKAGVTTAHKTAVALDLAKEFGIKASDDIVAKLPGEVYEKVIQKYATNKTINKELVERLALKKSDDVARILEKSSSGMSQELAEKIVLNSNKAKGITLGADEFAKETDKLIKSYNKAVGIPTNDVGITLSLGNVPFGNKIFGDLADKSYTVVSADKAKAFGDATFAKPYAQLRDTFYGSKLGGLFSNQSTLYKLSKTDPSALYDYLKFAERQKSLSKNTQLVQKAIAQKGKEFNLTPSEQLEVIELMEDESKWVQVKKAIKLSDLEEAEAFKNKILERQSKTQLQLDELLNQKSHIEALQLANDTGLADVKNTLDVMRKQYIDDLSNLKTSHITDKTKLQELIKTYGDELDKLNFEQDLLIEHNPTFVKNFSESFDEFANATKSGTPTSVTKHKLIEDASTYLFGRPDYISPTVWDAHFNKVANMIKYGEDKAKIIEYVDKNADYFYSGRAQTIYSYIGKKMGYGSDKVNKYANWKEMYHDRIKPIGDKLRKSEPLTIQEEELFAELQALKLKRDTMINEFRKQPSMEGINRIITEDANKALYDDYDNIRHINEVGGYDKTANELAREQKNINDYASEAISGVQKSYNKISDKSPVSGKIFTSANRNTAYSEIADKLFFNSKSFDVNSFGKSHSKWVNTVVDEVEPLLKSFFKNDYDNLSVKQKDLLYNMAVQNANKRADGAMLVGNVGQAELKAVLKERNARKQAFRNAYFTSKLNIGSTVKIKDGDNIIEGIVKSIDFNDDTKGLFSIMKNDGSVIGKVSIDQVQSVKSNAKLMSPEDIIRKSNATTDYIERHDDLVKLIDNAQGEINKLDGEYKTAYRDILNSYKERKQTLGTRIKELEVDQQNLTMAFAHNNVEKINQLTSKIKYADEVLSSDDAFETFMRSWFGDNNVDDLVDKNSPLISEFVLNPDLRVSDKVKSISEQLRKDLIEIGGSEVNIGQLTSGQFDTMMNRYLPHILTDDGRKLFETSEELNEHLSKLDLEFNTFSMERTIKRLPDGNGGYIDNPNITQINKYFNENFGHILKGKNAFSEDVADIYVTRALKNTKLLYDEKFSTDIIETFSKDYNGTLSKGYDTIINPTNYRNTSSDVAQLNVSMTISDAVSEYLKSTDVVQKIQNSLAVELGADKLNMVYHPSYKEKYSQAVQKYAKEFLQENYPDKVRRSMFEEELKVFNTSSTVGGALDDLSTPIIKFDKSNVEALTQSVSDVKERYLDHIRSKVIGYEKSKYYELHGKSMPKEVLETLLDYDMSDMVEYVAEARNHADALDLSTLDRITSNIDKLNSFREPNIKQLNTAIIDKSNQARLLQLQKDNSRFLQIYDKFTHFIKINQTSVMPSFHGRNKISNTFNNWLQIGADAVDVDFQRNAFKAITKQGDVDGVLKITNPDGSIGMIGWDDLYKYAEEYGVIGDGFFQKEIADNAPSQGLIKKLPGTLDPTDTKNFKLYSYGTKIGSTIEDQDRLIHFASQVSRGMSFEEASESVTKFLFDYSELTTFEHSVMKRIIPYYTWLRKNSALQLEMMIENPKKYMYVSKVLGGIDGMVDENDRINTDYVNEFAKDWVQTPWHVRNPQGRLEPVLWNPNLPYMDIGRIPNIFDPVGSAKDLFTQSNPLIKVPIEQLLNKNVYYDSPIVGEGENQFTKRADHILSQLALYNAGKDLATKTGVDLGLQVMNNTTGVKLLSYDYDKYKAMKIQEMLKDSKKQK